MKACGRAKVSDFLGDAIIYRNLQPLDPRLPSLEDLHTQVGLPQGVVPRKSTVDYARVVAQILNAGRALDAPQTPIRRVIFLGDTRLNDGTAFANICAAGGWPGLAFIGSERMDEAPKFEMEQRGENAHVYVANRWAALPEFAAYCAEQNFPVDESTAVLVDLDKTTLGARGRNDRVIDQVRVEAALQTVCHENESDGQQHVTTQNQPVYGRAVCLRRETQRDPGHIVQSDHAEQDDQPCWELLGHIQGEDESRSKGKGEEPEHGEDL